MNGFHDAKTSWAKIKHGILSNYLPLFVNKTSLFKRPIYLVDGFAGAGKYEDGQPGSALISAKIAVNPQTEASRGLLHCINVEKNPAAFAKLEEVTKFCVDLGFVQNIKGEFEKNSPRFWQGLTVTPPFFSLTRSAQKEQLPTRLNLSQGALGLRKFCPLR